MISRVSYNVMQGVAWDRLVVVKDRRTRRVIRPIDCWARIKVSDTTSVILRTEVTSEGAILLSMDEHETASLPAGDLEFDIIARHNKRQSLAYGSFTTYPGRFRGETITRPVVRGTLRVEAVDTVTPLNEEEIRMQQTLNIVFKKGADVRRFYSWNENGTLLLLQSAKMQARDSDGELVLDLNWFDPAPDEATVITLPGIERGYLAPAEEATMELHISDTNTVAPGTYHYDIFVQRTDEDWVYWMGGDLVVEEAVTIRT